MLNAVYYEALKALITSSQVFGVRVYCVFLQSNCHVPSIYRLFIVIPIIIICTKINICSMVNVSTAAMKPTITSHDIYGLKIEKIRNVLNRMIFVSSVFICS